MNQQTVPNPGLFDLLAREWQCPAARLCFNDDDTMLAIMGAEGAVAIARLADNEPPEARIKIESGQMTISPRQGRPAPLIRTRLQDGAAVSACRGGDFLVLTGHGELVRLSRAGEPGARLFADKPPLVAFDHDGSSSLTVAMAADRLYLQSEGRGVIDEIGFEGLTADILSISSDGSMIALAGADGLIVCRADTSCQPERLATLPSRPLSLRWSVDGRWLACGLETGGLCLLDTTSGRMANLTDFPGPVGVLGWSRAANALVASGAFRIAGWSMDTPPFDTSAIGALGTGRPGLAIVEVVAAHPANRLVAAGYANGRVVVAQIGSPEELIVRQAGGAVHELRWSNDGNHLALADSLGNVAVVTFPRQLFK
jgi:WD40 repeat protein